ncbi:hypothetical protein TRFO_37153 [Tritrichomonas foetus]|uniref:ATP-grasp domain-containing protein n=1 Tax=Tritrichomonas foetus TaxID=1144522 RepID=A0A1J4JDA4_9EUKA|nr:hypothetical protein TRFO_37153 [Tritrichomonas foetus]|eukprot:OHS96633.1 hypothetical protein TRFO_37153 [Tritrichomonas foetus]
MSEAGKTKRKMKKSTNKVLFANVNHTKYPSVKKCLTKLGYKFTDSITKSLLFWGDNEGTLDFVKNLEKWQFYNHFPGMWKIAHKVELVRNFERLQKLLPEYYNFHPRSFIIPSQLSDLKNFMSTIPRKSDRTFIIKPDKGSQGKGIFLIQDFDDLKCYFESAVAQQYISPFLVDRFKFDLRIYVLVTSVDPLRLYIHKEGMTRFCTEPYSPPSHSNLDNCFAHLTNFSLNKKSENFNDKSKRPMSEVFKSIENSGASIKQIQDEIDDIIRFTLISNLPQLAANYRTATNDCDGKSRLFEILGFDIFVDDQSHPWLIEVNSMPSLSTGSEFDLKLKTSVIEGTLKILDLKPNFKRICIARTRKVATQRMSGIGEALPSLFNPDHESEIAAKETNWRQIYPIENEEIMKKCEIALEKAKEAPIGGVPETAASRMRREAIIAMTKNAQQQLQPPEKPKYKLTKNRETLSARQITSSPQQQGRKRMYLKKSDSPNFPSSSADSFNINNKGENDIPNDEMKNDNFPAINTNSNLQKNNKLCKNNNNLINDDSSGNILSSHKLITININPVQDAPRPGTSNTRTPRSVILANEARANRIKANNSRNSNQKNISIMMLFENYPKLIIESEERERIKTLRKREVDCYSLNIVNTVKNYFSKNSSQQLRSQGNNQGRPTQQPIHPLQAIQLSRNARQIRKVSVPSVSIKVHNPNFA